MPTFTYTAIESESGKECSGTLDCRSAELASATLKARGYAPLSLTASARTAQREMAGVADSASQRQAKRSTPFAPLQRRRSTGISFGRAGGLNELTLFTRQLATLLKAGMPLLRGIEVLARQEKKAAFQRVLGRLADTIRSGGNLSTGLAQYPRTFDDLYLNMVKAGEAGGMLDTVLDRLARFMEKNARLKAKVKSAMAYPVIVILLAVGIVGAMMVFVVPRFEQIFTGLLKGQPLPMLTQVVLNISNVLKDHALLTSSAVLGAIAAFVVASRTQKGRRIRDWLLIRLPLVGDLFLKGSIARFTRTFGTLLSSGVPILQALSITRATSGNVHVAEAIDLVHDRVKEGENVAAPLASAHVFPPMVTSMIEVGEETGALPEMLVRIADTYDDEVDTAVAGLTSLIEPIMIVGLALIVGSIVIALFLPIVSIIQHLQ